MKRLIYSALTITYGLFFANTLKAAAPNSPAGNSAQNKSEQQKSSEKTKRPLDTIQEIRATASSMAALVTSLSELQRASKSDALGEKDIPRLALYLINISADIIKSIKFPKENHVVFGPQTANVEQAWVPLFNKYFKKEFDAKKIQEFGALYTRNFKIQQALNAIAMLEAQARTVIIGAKYNESVERDIQTKGAKTAAQQHAPNLDQAKIATLEGFDKVVKKLRSALNLQKDEKEKVFTRLKGMF